MGAASPANAASEQSTADGVRRCGTAGSGIRQNSCSFDAQAMSIVQVQSASVAIAEPKGFSAAIASVARILNIRPGKPVGFRLHDVPRSNRNSLAKLGKP